MLKTTVALPLSKYPVFITIPMCIALHINGNIPYYLDNKINF